MLANRGNATFNGYLSNIDLSGELCVHIWKDDTTHNEETFITSDQNWCREELTAERSLSDLSSNLHTEPDLFWGAGGESLSKILWNSLTLGQGLELTPEQFCAEAWAVILRVSHSEFPEPYWNTLSRCNGLHSSGMKIMPAHISEAWRGSLWQEAEDIGRYQRSCHFKAERLGHFLVLPPLIEKIEAQGGKWLAQSLVKSGAGIRIKSPAASSLCLWVLQNHSILSSSRHIEWRYIHCLPKWPILFPIFSNERFIPHLLTQNLISCSEIHFLYSACLDYTHR